MTQDEMNRLIAGAETLSEKIRILDRAGVAKADIARHVGRRYQHIYNVLKPVGGNRASLRSAGDTEESGAAAAMAGVQQLPLERDGTARLPAAWLEGQGLTAGDDLFCRIEGEGLTIMSRSAAIAALREVARKTMPGQASLLEALLGAEPRK